MTRAETTSNLETTMTTETTICGNRVHHDNSGSGHNWQVIDRDDIPANIVTELECEMIDGGVDSCDDYVASNGLHYRW